MIRLSSLLLCLAACSSSGDKKRSLDGFLAPYTEDMAVGGGTTGGGTTGGGTTGGGTTGGGTTGGGTTGGGTTGGTGLDPLLDPAGGSGQVCNLPGSLNCPNFGVCRFYTTTEARCEDPGAGLGLNAACTHSVECDTIFVCYAGKCQAFCHIGLAECGGTVSDCVDVGWMNHDIGACQN